MFTFLNLQQRASLVLSSHNPLNKSCEPYQSELAYVQTMSGPADQSAAVATAATSQAQRVIDENTDLSTLTDQEIMKLMEGMGQEDVSNKVSQFFFNNVACVRLLIDSR